MEDVGGSAELMSSSSKRNKSNKLGKLTRYRICLIGFVVAFLVFFCTSAEYTRRQLLAQYQSGMDKMVEGDYPSAIDTLDALGDYKDSKEYIELMQSYEAAKLLLEHGLYEEAKEAFSLLGDFLDSEDLAAQANNMAQEQAEYARLYKEACEYYRLKDFTQALTIFNKLGDYHDSQQIAQYCKTALTRIELSNTISAGIRYSVGITQNGSAVLAGDFVGVDPIKTWRDIVSISGMGKLVIGLKEDGTVVTAKEKAPYDYDCRIDTSDWTDIIEVSAGEQYIVGLKADGTLKTQGIDGYGETAIDDWEKIVAISTAWQLTVGLDSAGEVHITGRDSEDLLEKINEDKENWTGVVDIAAGGGRNKVYGEAGHVVALKNDGTVVAVGDNRKGQCNVTGEEWTDIVAISAGAFHTVGLKADGTVVTTLDPQHYSKSNRIISNWKHIVSISAGYGLTLGLTEDGDVVGAGSEDQGQIPTESWLKNEIT